MNVRILVGPQRLSLLIQVVVVGHSVGLVLTLSLVKRLTQLLVSFGIPVGFRLEACIECLLVSSRLEPLS